MPGTLLIACRAIFTFKKPRQRKENATKAWMLYLFLSCRIGSCWCNKWSFWISLSSSIHKIFFCGESSKKTPFRFRLKYLEFACSKRHWAPLQAGTFPATLVLLLALHPDERSGAKSTGMFTKIHHFPRRNDYAKATNFQRSKTKFHNESLGSTLTCQTPR